jgi:hypothetical protein
MNNAPHEQLFRDMNPTQAETIAGGFLRDSVATIPDDQTSVPKYGSAWARIAATGPSSFYGSLSIKDLLADGYPVYAQFQAKASESAPIVTGSTRFYDRKGAKGNGRYVDPIRASFGRGVDARFIRVAILRDNPGRDLFVAGNWIDFEKPW